MTSVGVSFVGLPLDCSSMDGPSLLGFWDKRRRNRFYGRGWGLRSKGDRRGRWLIRLTLVWLISVRLGWGVIDQWWNIGFLEYPRSGIL